MRPWTTTRTGPWSSDPAPRAVTTRPRRWPRRSCRCWWSCRRRRWCEADDAFHRISDQGYGWPLWGAAYLLNGGCGDDGFDDFRGWLVTRGRAVFEAALADPDSLADVVTTDELSEVACEDVLGAAWEAHQQLTGRNLPAGSARAPRPELGEGWDFDDDAEMRRRYPRISALVDRAG